MTIGRRTAVLLPLGVAGVAAWYFQELIRLVGDETGLVWLVLGVPVFLAMLTILAVVSAPPAPVFPAQRGASSAVIFGAVVLLFCISAARDLEKFPRVLDGESADATNNAELILRFAERGYVGERIRAQAIVYNVGLVPIMVPVVRWFGPGPAAAKWTNIAAAAIFLAGGLALMAGRVRLALPRPVWWLVWLTPVCYGALLASVRQYRWHMIALLASLGIMMASRALERDRRIRAFAAGLLLFALGLFLYHGCIIYTPVLALLAIWHLLLPEDGTRRWLPAVGFMALGVGLFFGVRAFEGTDIGVFARAGTDLGIASALLDGNQLISMARRLLVVPGDELTWPGAAILLLGFCAMLRRMPHCALSRASLLMLFAGFAANILAQGFGNPSQNCWFLLPAVFCAALGLGDAGERIFAAIPSVPVAALLGATVCGFVAFHEWGAYRSLGLYRRLDSFPKAWRTNDQLALVVREIGRAQQVESRPTHHFLPALDLSARDGGFDRQIPLNHVSETNLREVTEFASVAELERVFEAGKHAHSLATDVVWVSWQPEGTRDMPTPLEAWLGAHGFRSRLVWLDTDPDLEPTPVWKYSRRRSD